MTLVAGWLGRAQFLVAAAAHTLLSPRRVAGWSAAVPFFHLLLSRSNADPTIANSELYPANFNSSNFPHKASKQASEHPAGVLVFFVVYLSLVFARRVLVYRRSPRLVAQLLSFFV